MSDLVLCGQVFVSVLSLPSKLEWINSVPYWSFVQQPEAGKRFRFCWV